MTIETISLEEARVWFSRLPAFMRIATLSPDYCAIDAKREDGLEPAHILFRDRSRDYFWLNNMHKSVVPASDFCDLRSPYGYGGPVSLAINDLELGDDFNFIAWKQYTQWCWEHNILAEFVRLHPLLKQPYGGNKRLNRKTVVVPINARYSDSCRNKVNKAQREGVSVRYGDPKEMRMFAREYYKGLERLKAEKFYYFSDNYFDAMATWDKSHLLMAEIDGCFVSGGIFLEGGDTLEYHLSTTNERGRDSAATNALIDTGLRLAKELGLKQLYLGGGKTDNPGDPLFTFKKSFGGIEKDFYVGEAIHRPDVYYEMMDHAFDVPPTSNKALWWR